MMTLRKILVFILLALALYLSFSQFLIREQIVSKLFALMFFVFTLYIGFENIKALVKSRKDRSS